MQPLILQHFRFALKMILILLVLEFPVLSLNAVFAAQPSEEYRVIFSGADKEISDDEKHAEANRAAIQYITKVLSHWQHNRKARFFFVSRPFQFCEEAPTCDPDFLLWQRINAVIATARAAAIKSGSRLRLKTLDGVFVERRNDYSLPPSLEKLDSLHLRVIAEENIRPDNRCPWLVRVRDPDLPAGSNVEAPMIPLMANSKQAVGFKAKLQVLEHGLRRGKFYAFWEDDQGQFKLAGDGLAKGNIVAIPSSSVTLHLVAVSQPTQKMANFLNQLDGRYKSLSIPKALRKNNQIMFGRTRGTGDHVRKVSSVSTQLIWPKTSSIQQCQFRLMVQR